MENHIQTLLSVANHILRSHPELAPVIQNICCEVQGRRNEFDSNIKKWFSAKGDETLRLDYPLNPDSVVFDLGGYRGDFAAEISRRYGCKVFLFEPCKEFFSHCAKRFAENVRIQCLYYGLSNQDGRFFLTPLENASRIDTHATQASVEEVTVRNITAVIEELKLGQIDLIKINVEGAEFDILSALIESGYISRLNHIQVQFHEFHPDSWSLRDKIRIQLGKTHTESWNFPFVWESWSKK
jgi:FkbM family methyltransferase